MDKIKYWVKVYIHGAARKTKKRKMLRIDLYNG